MSPLVLSSDVAFAVFRFVVSTLPFLVALIYLLYVASQRGSSGGFNNADDTGPFSLMDTLLVFLLCHVIWTLFCAYLLFFIPKRRQLLNRYLDEGEQTLGDVIFNQSAIIKFGAYWRFQAFRDYGYAMYSYQPSNSNTMDLQSSPVVIRKQVRVYQPFTRTAVPILTLPQEPFSGQPKIDIEIDLHQTRTERDTTLRYIAAVSIFWILFSLAGATYCTYQMSAIEGNDDDDNNNNYGVLIGNENPKLARRILLIVVGMNPFFAFIVTWIRFWYYNNWMVHRGVIDKDDNDGQRTIQHCSLNDNTSSADGVDATPYNILDKP